MTNRNDFNERIEKFHRHSSVRNSESPRDRAVKSVSRTIFEIITDIFLFGWWAFFAGIVTFIFLALAVLHFVGFEVEFFLAAAFVLLIAFGLAWHLWES